MTHLEIYKVDKLDADVKRIYKDCFGDSGIPFSFIVPKKNDKNCELIGYKDNGKVVGFSHLITNNDITYVMFLGVDNSMRSKGYGSLILDYVKSKNKRIALNMQEVLPRAKNYEQRQKRERFYFRNGFSYTNITFGVGVNNTCLLVFDKAQISYKEYCGINKIFIGKFLFFFIKPLIKVKKT